MYDPSPRTLYGRTCARAARRTRSWTLSSCFVRRPAHQAVVRQGVRWCSWSWYGVRGGGGVRGVRGGGGVRGGETQ